MTDCIVDIKALEFAYQGAKTLINLPSFEVREGETVFLKGASGSGKSTLLGLIAGVLRPKSGSVKVLNHQFSELSGTQRDRVRANHIGVIFQQFNLMPYLGVIDNVVLPCKFSNFRRNRLDGDPYSEAKRLLSRLGVDASLYTRTRVLDLSVGQQQRVAVARALIGNPNLVIADEPTSALDADARDMFIELLLEEVKKSSAALMFVSHDAGLARFFERGVVLEEINMIVESKREL